MKEGQDTADANPRQMIDLLEIASHQASAEERAVFLESLPDSGVRSGVQSLLELQDAERTQTIDFRPGAGSSGGPRSEVRFEGTERFETLSVLGTGGFGTVYRVFDRERNTEAALKILRERNPRVLYRFKREFRTLANLRHPNLVRLYELFAEGDRWFYTMELVEGANFHQHSGGRDLTALRRVLPQLVGALDHLHAQGFLHLDIKPPNVFVSTEGRLVLLDFGMVREIYGVGPQSITLCGTPEFMAPEQVERTIPTAAADWYAVGAMLYQVLTGQLPFTGTTLEIFARKLDGEPRPAASLRPDAPPDLARLCTDLLQRDPARRPGAAAILERLGESAPPHVEAVQPDIFVGRAAQLREMRDCWARVGQGSTVALNISGKSGFGKSMLLRAFTGWLAESSPEATVLAGRCRQNESVPFKALDEVIDALSQRILSLPTQEATALTPPRIELAARLFPVLGQLCRDDPESAAGGDSLEMRRRAFAVLIEFLGRISARSPLVVSIDDLQWGDADSAIFLRELLASRRPPSMLLVCSFRTEDTEASEPLRLYRAALQERSAAVELTSIEVGEFAADESVEYAVRLLGDDTARCQAIVRESAGNPLLMAQMARYADPDGADPAGLSVQTMVEKRLTELPEAARSLLEAVALADQPLLQSTIQRAAGVNADDFSGAWMLVSERLARTSDQGGHKRIECYHDKIREAVVARLEPERRREWHRRLATALEHQGGVEPALLATHFAGAAEREKTAHYARFAAEAAHFALAFDRATEFYQLTLEHGNHPPEERRALYRRIANALACGGRGNRAAEAYLKAAEGAPPAEMLDLQRLAAEQYLLAGNNVAGAELLYRVVRSAGLRVPKTGFGVVCSLLFHRAWIKLRGLGFRERDAAEISPRVLLAFDVCQTAGHCLAPIDYVRAAEFHSRALLIGLRAGEPRRVALALGREAMDLAGWGARSAARSQVVMATAQVLTDRIGDPRLQAEQVAFNGTRCMFLGRWRECTAEYERTRRIRQVDDAGTVWLSSVVDGLYFVGDHYNGEVRSLSENFGARLRAMEDRGSLFGIVNLRVRVAYLVRLAEDDPQRARQDAAEGMARWPQRPYVFQNYFGLFANTEIDLYDAAGSPEGARGMEERAYGRMQQEWKLLERAMLRFMQSVGVESTFAKARTAIALAAIRPELRKRLLAEAARDVRYLVRTRAGWAQAMAALLRAGIAAVTGDPQTALVELAMAERQFDECQMLLFAAVARRQAGRLSGGEDGRARIAAADQWMTTQAIRNPERMAHMMAPGFRGCADK